MVKKLTERQEAWFRLVVFIVSGIILAVWRYLIYILIIINWLITVFSGKRHKELAIFSEHWNTEVYKFMRYMTFVSNKKPFPFSSMERLSKFDK
jgi:hypothetical protein